MRILCMSIASYHIVPVYPVHGRKHARMSVGNNGLKAYEDSTNTTKYRTIYSTSLPGKYPENYPEKYLVPVLNFKKGILKYRYRYLSRYREKLRECVPSGLQVQTVQTTNPLYRYR